MLSFRFAARQIGRSKKRSNFTATSTTTTTTTTTTSSSNLSLSNSFGWSSVSSASRWYCSHSEIAKTTPAELKIIYRHGIRVQMLDVRPLEEYKKTRIVGALTYPLENIDKTALKLNKEDKVAIYCDKATHGNPEGEEEVSDSLKAAKVLLKLGFKDVSVIEGSINELKQEGFCYNSIYP